VVDDLPEVPVGVGEERVGPTQRRRRRRLDHAAGAGGLLDRGVDLVVGGDVDGQDGLPLAWPASAAATSLPPSSASSVSLYTSRRLPAVLNIDMAGVEAADSSQPSAV
jgi:hypothetical protein